MKKLKKSSQSQKISISFEVLKSKNTIKIVSEIRCSGKTGVEMEALTAVQVALLTIYDMCKAVDRGMVMGDIQLLEKSGGKSGDWKAGK